MSRILSFSDLPHLFNLYPILMMFVEPFVTLEKKDQNEEFIQDVVTRLDKRNMNGGVKS